MPQTAPCRCARRRLGCTRQPRFGKTVWAECTTAPRFIGSVGASSYGVRLTGRSAPKPRPGHHGLGRGGITVALRAVP